MEVAVQEISAITWLDHVQVWITLGGALVAAVGLGAVVYTLVHASRRDRVESGPYVRVDISPHDGTEDFQPPIAHYIRSNDAMVIGPRDAKDTIAISAWVTNYQPHALGFALAVRPFFVVEYRVTAQSAPESEGLEVEIPYLQFQKPVEIEIVKLPKDWVASVTLMSLSFYDVYERRHSHQTGGASSNALHGRLSCEYVDGRFVSTPEAWPRGSKVEFDQ